MGNLNLCVQVPLLRSLSLGLPYSGHEAMIFKSSPGLEASWRKEGLNLAYGVKTFPQEPLYRPRFAMQIVQVQLGLSTLFSNFPTGSTNVPYGQSPGLFSGSSWTAFLLATVWSAPWAQAQPENRMEGSGRRQLTGEPTFLTQVPKQSDANTPSAPSSPS